MRPFTVVEVVKDGKREDNEALAGKIEVQITEITIKLLSDKFKLTPIYTLADTIKGTDLVPYLLALDENSKKAKGSATPLFIQKAFYTIPNRYCMLVLYLGQYDLDLEAYLKISAARNNMMYVREGAGSSQMRVLIFDTKLNTLIHYGHEKKAFDPRVPSAVKTLVTDMLRPVYYKKFLKP